MHEPACFVNVSSLRLWCYTDVHFSECLELTLLMIMQAFVLWGVSNCAGGEHISFSQSRECIRHALVVETSFAFRQCIMHALVRIHKLSLFWSVPSRCWWWTHKPLFRHVSVARVRIHEPSVRKLSWESVRLKIFSRCACGEHTSSHVSRVFRACACGEDTSFSRLENILCMRL